MNYDDFLKKAKDLIEIEFYIDKEVSPKMILSEVNIFDFMEARQFQQQANGLIIVDFTILSHQLGGGDRFKDYVAQIMQNLRKDRQVYIYVSEAYFCKGDDSKGDLQGYLNKHGTLENHPDRIDCMMLNYFDGDNLGIWINEIVNPETDRAFLTKWFNPNPEHKGKQIGRFTDEND